jgi:hypothetical protein
MLVLLVYKSKIADNNTRKTRNSRGCKILMASHNEIHNDLSLQFNISTYRPRKPLIMDLQVMRIPIHDGEANKLQYYIKLKDKLQNAYENAIKSKQRFVIPRLKSFKQKYSPPCCSNRISEIDPLSTDHSHFEFKIIQLLDTLKKYLEDTIKVPQRILEIKLLESSEK